MVFLYLRDLKTHFPIYRGLVARRQIGSVKAVDGVTISLQKGEAASFEQRIKADKTIKKYLKPKALAECFDLKPYIRHAKMVWVRVKSGK